MVQLRATIAWTLPVGGSGGPNGLTWDGSHLWSCDCDSFVIERIEPATGKSVRSFRPVDSIPAGLAWDGSSLWVSVPYHLKLYALDPADGAVRRSLPAPAPKCHGVTWDGSHLWTSCPVTDRFYRVDPKPTAASPAASRRPAPARTGWSGGKASCGAPIPTAAPSTGSTPSRARSSPPRRPRTAPSRTGSPGPAATCGSATSAPRTCTGWSSPSGGLMAGRLRIGVIGANPTQSWAKRGHLPAILALPEELELAAVCTTR